MAVWRDGAMRTRDSVLSRHGAWLPRSRLFCVGVMRDKAVRFRWVVRAEDGARKPVCSDWSWFTHGPADIDMRLWYYSA